MSFGLCFVWPAEGATVSALPPMYLFWIWETNRSLNYENLTTLFRILTKIIRSMKYTLSRKHEMLYLISPKHVRDNWAMTGLTTCHNFGMYSMMKVKQFMRDLYRLITLFFTYIAIVKNFWCNGTAVVKWRLWLSIYCMECNPLLFGKKLNFLNTCISTCWWTMKTDFLSISWQE